VAGRLPLADPGERYRPIMSGRRPEHHRHWLLQFAGPTRYCEHVQLGRGGSRSPRSCARFSARQRRVGCAVAVAV